MKNQSRRMALAGMMVALGTAAMLLGGVIPMATFCCPAIAGLALLPVVVECGRKWTVAAYAAVAALSLMLSPDKESALLFAFLGYYPALKTVIDRIPRAIPRLLAKLAVFNLAAGAMMLMVTFVLDMQAIVQEYAEMTRGMLIAFVLLANLTLLIYDRMLAVMSVVYVRKLRPKLKFK